MVDKQADKGQSLMTTHNTTCDVHFSQSPALVSTDSASATESTAKPGSGVGDKGSEFPASLGLKLKDLRVDRAVPLEPKMEFDAVKIDGLLRRRFFVAPSFEIYGSSAGLIDLGPNGCAVKNQLESLWRRHFVLEENLMEIFTPNLTPHSVLKASGHVDRFLDLVLEDTVTKECYRADKYISEVLSHVLEHGRPKDKAVPLTAAAPNKGGAGKAEKKGGAGGKGGAEGLVLLDSAEREEFQMMLNQLEGMDAEGMKAVIDEHRIVSPNGNPLSTPYPFNLMFATKVGPKPPSAASDLSGVAYLRPETAQGIFVNFRRLYEQNNNRMPFGAACLGTSFRNEIAPRNGLLRVREFPMAEIEFFCDPTAKSPFTKFAAVKDLELPLFDRKSQMTTNTPRLLTLEAALKERIIDNETLAYFIGRTFLFLRAIGIQQLRFRQHLDTEMAHYASDCWDCEIWTSYKWVECVGIADRSAFDLSQHSKATNVDLRASRVLKEPRVEQRLEAVLNRKLLGPLFKTELANVLEAVANLTEEEKIVCMAQLDQDGFCEIAGKKAADSDGNEGSGAASSKPYRLDRNVLSFEEKTVKVSEESFVPNVIEPSFGIGRILHALFEHSFKSRGIADQSDRNFLAFSPLVAPVKCSILPLSGNPDFEPSVEKLRVALLREDVSVKIDASNTSVGKRYARTDEIGIPFGLTVDFQTVQDQTVTLRERDSMEQVRLPMADVPQVVRRLVRMDETWEDIKAKYPLFTQQQVD